MGKNSRNAGITSKSQKISEIFASRKRIVNKLRMTLNQLGFNIFKHSISNKIACSFKKHKDLEIKDLY